MPNRNLNQINKSDAYYVQLKGLADEEFFYCESDYYNFLSLIGETIKNSKDIEIFAYCLAQNNIKLLLGENKTGSAQEFVHELFLKYNEYYSNEYGCEDVLSETNCEITFIDNERLLDISRKVHTTPRQWADCQFSSVRAYLYDDAPEWLNKKKIAETYGSAVKYFKFLKK